LAGLSELREGATNDLDPSVGVTGGDDFAFDQRKAVEEELSDIGEGGGMARGNAVVGERDKEFAEDVVEVVGGAEFAGEGDELGAHAVGFEELLLPAGVEEAERGVPVPAEHAAGATVGGGELAARGNGARRGFLSAVSGFRFHGSLKEKRFNLEGIEN
jgi:hypothetical protein